MSTIDVALLILIIAAIALCVAVIIYLRRIVAQMEQVRTDIHDLVGKLLPVIENISHITERANRIALEAENYWDEIDRSIKNLKEKVSRLTSFQGLRDSENPAKSLIRNLRSFAKGFSAFWSEFSK